MKDQCSSYQIIILSLRDPKKWAIKWSRRAEQLMKVLTYSKVYDREMADESKSKSTPRKNGQKRFMREITKEISFCIYAKHEIATHYKSSRKTMYTCYNQIDK